jgi:hypothetical protein
LLVRQVGSPADLLSITVPYTTQRQYFAFEASITCR